LYYILYNMARNVKSYKLNFIMNLGLLAANRVNVSKGNSPHMTQKNAPRFTRDVKTIYNV